MMEILLAILTILIILYVWVKKRFSYWTDRGFEQADVIFPFGSTKDVGTKFTLAEKLDEHYRIFKGKAAVIGFYNFLSPAILLIDPQLIKNILVREFSSFHDRGFYYNKEDDPVTANLLTLEGQDWKDKRLKISPMFSSGKMKLMFDILDSIGDKFVSVIGNELKKSDKIEMQHWLQRYTSENIGNVGFGLECNCLGNYDSEFLKYGKKFFEINLFNLKFIFSSEWPSIARKLGLMLTSKDVGDFFLNAFGQTFDYREKNDIMRNDFVSLLLGYKHSYTKTELAAEAFIIFAAGYETSSNLMSFILYELAQNQDIQDRLRNEILDGIKENDGKLTYDLLHDFKYLDMVINETLRKYPIVPNTFRKCTKEYQIPDTNLIIPKDTRVIIDTFSLHRDPEYFPEPNKFDPERFSDENIENIRPFTYIPFAEGPRNCVGARFGIMQTKVGVAKLIQHFKFFTYEKTSIPIKFIPTAPFLMPIEGIWLKVVEI